MTKYTITLTRTESVTVEAHHIEVGSNGELLVYEDENRLSRAYARTTWRNFMPTADVPSEDDERPDYVKLIIDHMNQNGGEAPFIDLVRVCGIPELHTPARERLRRLLDDNGFINTGRQHRRSYIYALPIPTFA